MYKGSSYFPWPIHDSIADLLTLPYLTTLLSAAKVLQFLLRANLRRCLREKCLSKFPNGIGWVQKLMGICTTKALNSILSFTTSSSTITNFQVQTLWDARKFVFVGWAELMACDVIFVLAIDNLILIGFGKFIIGVCCVSNFELKCVFFVYVH